MEKRWRRDVYVGFLCTQPQKAKLSALAQLQGQPMSRTLTQLIEEAAARAGIIANNDVKAETTRREKQTAVRQQE